MENGEASITVRLGAHDLLLRRPTSTATAWDVASSTGRSASRGVAAALGVCWHRWAGPELGSPRRLAARLEAARWDVLAYGGLVFDELVAAGLTPGAILSAGTTALAWLVEGLPTEQEVAAAADFSAGEAASIETSSPSAAITGATSDGGPT